MHLAASRIFQGRRKVFLDETQICCPAPEIPRLPNVLARPLNAAVIAPFTSTELCSPDVGTLPQILSAVSVMAFRARLLVSSLMSAFAEGRAATSDTTMAALVRRMGTFSTSKLEILEREPC